jgi:hypothetical protein
MSSMSSNVTISGNFPNAVVEPRDFFRERGKKITLLHVKVTFLTFFLGAWEKITLLHVKVCALLEFFVENIRVNIEIKSNKNGDLKGAI